VCLRFLHPFMPFVTEELWGRLKERCQSRTDNLGPEEGWEEALAIARWPGAEPALPGDEESIAQFAQLMELVRAIRNARAEKGVPAGRRIAAILHAGPQWEFYESQREVLQTLAKLDAARLRIIEDGEAPADAMLLMVGLLEAYLPLAGMVDAAEEKARLAAELAEVEGQMQRLEALLGGPFATRAPEQVVDKERAKLEEYRQMREKLLGQIAALG
jgi:valyl-tRNA synthetase